MQTCEHVDISSSSNMGRQINPNNISHVFTSTLSQLFGCKLSVTRVTEMTLAPTRTGHKNPANESKPPFAGKWPSNHRFNVWELSTVHLFVIFAHQSCGLIVPILFHSINCIPTWFFLVAFSMSMIVYGYLPLSCCLDLWKLHATNKKPNNGFLRWCDSLHLGRSHANSSISLICYSFTDHFP